MGCFSTKHASNRIITEPNQSVKTKSSRLEEDLQMIDNFFLKRAKVYIVLDLESNPLRLNRKNQSKTKHNTRFN